MFAYKETNVCESATKGHNEQTDILGSSIGKRPIAPPFKRNVNRIKDYQRFLSS